MNPSLFLCQRCQTAVTRPARVCAHCYPWALKELEQERKDKKWFILAAILLIVLAPLPVLRDEMLPGYIAALALLWGVMVYFVPSMITHHWYKLGRRSGHDLLKLALLNLAVAWTIIGWLALLVFACTWKEDLAQPVHTPQAQQPA